MTHKLRMVAGVLAAVLVILLVVSVFVQHRESDSGPSLNTDQTKGTQESTVPFSSQTTVPSQEPTVPTVTPTVPSVPEPTETTVTPTVPSVPQPTETTATPTVPSVPEPTETIPVIPADDAFVKVSDWIPDIVLDIRYATTNNFTGEVIYDFSDAWLRYGTVKKLMAVQQELRKQDLYLKIWDGFRPPSAQFKLWNICPDPTYVSNPNVGFSSHSRGNTVDITLVDANGVELKMPTGFDDFSKLADRDYSDCDSESAANAKMLESIMEKHGFKPYRGEWWHFSDSVSYEVEHNFVPG